jgi:hypothetical protein
MNLHPATIPTYAEYDAAFQAERLKEYPEVDAYEHLCGYELDRAILESAAVLLACPVKKSPPNWQHGRVLYAAIRAYLAEHRPEYVLCFDCGTAKGFSALVTQWALNDAETQGVVHSVDVIDPKAEVFRNSVFDCEGPHVLADYLRPWPEATAIQFYKITGTDWLASDMERVNIAFIDGKHSTQAVAADGKLLANRQDRGDLAVFDDAQIPAVAQALLGLERFYEFQYIALSGAQRTYAVGVRR